MSSWAIAWVVLFNLSFICSLFHWKYFFCFNSFLLPSFVHRLSAQFEKEERREEELRIIRSLMGERESREIGISVEMNNFWWILLIAPLLPLFCIRDLLFLQWEKSKLEQIDLNSSVVMMWEFLIGVLSKIIKNCLSLITETDDFYSDFNGILLRTPSYILIYSHSSCQTLQQQ